MAISKEKAKLFAEAYIEEGYNATKTVRRIEPSIKEKSKGYQRLKGHRLITNDSVQARLRDILEERGLNNEEIERLLSRNARQNKNIPASNQAIDMAIKVKGEYAPSKSVSLSVDLTEKQLNEGIDELLRELKQLK